MSPMRWLALVGLLCACQTEVVQRTEIGQGARVASTGKVLLTGAAQLSRLEDQVGSTVSLRGTAWSMNGHWWFEYRGTKLHVEGMSQYKLRDWTVDRHGQEMEIRGKLAREELPGFWPDVERSGLQYVIRSPSWQPIEGLLIPERVR